MTSTPTLCVGGPLDGQYRTMPDSCTSFRVASIPCVPLTLRYGTPPAPKLIDQTIGYKLVWSRKHGRMVWWAKEGEQ